MGGNWRDGSNDHDLDYDDDDDDDDDDAPDCYRCGDSDDVTSDDWGDWWCSHCEIEIDDDGDLRQSDCHCGQTAAADCPNGECGSCCSGCKRHGGDWVPDCDSCDGYGEVTGPDEDDDYYCSHCDHYIDEDGDCVSDCDSCGQDDEYEEPDLSAQYCPGCGNSNCEIFVLQKAGGV